MHLGWTVSVPTAGFGTRLLSPWSCCSPSSADGHLLLSLLPCGRCCPPCLTSLFHKNDLLCHILQLFQPFVWEITFPFPIPTKLHLKPVLNGPKQAPLALGEKVASGRMHLMGISLVLLLFPFWAGGRGLVIRESDGIEKIFNLVALLAAHCIVH